ncbi:hypothetical protein FGO68_gene6235 [Halteria grandinella]|uniref:Uncharacterized protein n=1 Tax=Halteria grandinella TaxID=5974 RepID=A0A8J8T6R8_HALGN|nr:hypothetical protein FGO68_gene6235 [Halteria grandinella]
MRMYRMFARDVERKFEKVTQLGYSQMLFAVEEGNLAVEDERGGQGALKFLENLEECLANNKVCCELFQKYSANLKRQYSSLADDQLPLIPFFGTPLQVPQLAPQQAAQPMPYPILYISQTPPIGGAGVDPASRMGTINREACKHGEFKPIVGGPVDKLWCRVGNCIANIKHDDQIPQVQCYLCLRCEAVFCFQCYNLFTGNRTLTELLHYDRLPHLEMLPISTSFKRDQETRNAAVQRGCQIKLDKQSQGYLGAKVLQFSKFVTIDEKYHLCVEGTEGKEYNSVTLPTGKISLYDLTDYKKIQPCLNIQWTLPHKPLHPATALSKKKRLFILGGLIAEQQDFLENWTKECYRIDITSKDTANAVQKFWDLPEVLIGPSACVVMRKYQAQAQDQDEIIVSGLSFATGKTVLYHYSSKIDAWVPLSLPDGVQATHFHIGTQCFMRSPSSYSLLLYGGLSFIQGNFNATNAIYLIEFDFHGRSELKKQAIFEEKDYFLDNQVLWGEYGFKAVGRYAVHQIEVSQDKITAEKFYKIQKADAKYPQIEDE